MGQFSAECAAAGGASLSLTLFDRQREVAPAPDDRVIELAHELLGVVFVERARIRVAQLGKPVRRGFDRQLVVAVELLRLVAVRARGFLRRALHVGGQVEVVLVE